MLSPTHSLPQQQQQQYHHAFTRHNPSIPDAPPCGRLARIGNNSRNTSDNVFAFGGVMDDVTRYRTDAAAAETERRQVQRDRRSKRVEVRRNWLENIETRRWDVESATHERAAAHLAMKQGASRLGVSRSGYNPITNTYAPTAEGQQLAERDQIDMRNLAHRATTNYLRLNTFDPITGKDVHPIPTPNSNSNSSENVNSKRYPRRTPEETMRHVIPPEPAAFREGFQKALKEAVPLGEVRERGKRRCG
ncbi:hypothetical protein DFJ77DRAFT_460011 [Powellomyces hirtus]|nr:hypothetical protein DFJ77DRAFT_460011 [Powellomyces hirtus]